MRLVYVTSARIPSKAANAVQSLKMCDAFVDAGASVRMIVRRGDDGDIVSDYGIRNRFSIEACEARGLRGTRTLALELAFRKAARRAPTADVFFARDVFALCSLVTMRRPMMLELHRTMENHRAEQVALAWLSRRPELRAVVVVSRAMAAWYEERFPALPLVVEPGAADERDAPTLRDVVLREERKLRVGYVGHLYAGRGVELIAVLASRLGDVDFHVVGGTDADLRRCRETLSAPNLVFHGHVAHARLPALLSTFDVLLAPYQRRVLVEGGAETSSVMSPLKLFEYMSYGRPIVVSDLPVIREVMDDEIALFMDPEDVDGWVRAIVTMRDPVLRSRLGIAAWERFRARHTWRARAERILARYAEKT